MARDCYLDTAGCLVCPEEPAQAYVPAYIAHSANIGWNAGANSIAQLAGDLHLVFTVAQHTAGAVIGLKTARSSQTVPDAVRYGFYFQLSGAFDLVQVIERGLLKTSAVARAAADRFEVRRIGTQVTYWQNDSLVYTSLVPSTGALIANACLYATGDAV